MKPEASLRGRIVHACVGLALVLCSVYALLAWFGIGVVEDRLLDDRLVAAADGLIRNQLEGSRAPIPGDAKVHADEDIPAPLRALAPGLHEIAMDGRTLHVYVKEKMGHRYAIVDDESGFERLEGLVWAALGSAFAFCLGLALLLGATTSRRVIRPLVELAEAVEQDRLRSGLAALERPDEVGVLARALVAHDEEAARFLVRERLFTGDVSHELRTPLTVMLGAAEVLASRLGERPDLLAVVERIRRTATETADRVAALMLLSRAPHDLEVRTVSLAPLLEQETDRCRPLLEGKPVELQLRLEAEPQVPGQPELMAIAVGNLLRNACYFTEAGHVRVTLREHELRIEDTGRGIPAAVQGQVFERFVSGDDRPPGAGLGLAIVQRVCEHLGWTVQLENSDAGGTVFSLAFGSAASSTH